MDTIKIRRCALPISIHTSDATHAVLGLHGFGGYAGELALPVGLLTNRGFAAYVPRLPGHGTNQDDFDLSTGNDWYTTAREAYIDLSNRYETVSVIGHSLGGTLALLLAEEFSIGKMVLLAPAIELKSWIFPFVGILRLFKHRIPIPWKADPSVPFFDERDPDDDEFLGNEYWGCLNVKQINQLRLLQKRAHRALKDVSGELLVITGGKDLSVPQSVGELLVTRTSAHTKVLHLPDASHLIPYDPDSASRDKAMSSMIEFFCD